MFSYKNTCVFSAAAVLSRFNEMLVMLIFGMLTSKMESTPVRNGKLERRPIVDSLRFWFPYTCKVEGIVFNDDAISILKI